MKTEEIPELLDKDKARFWSKVDKKCVNECWEWIGCKAQGYGRIKVYGKLRQASHVSWILARGPIPQGKSILHRCDNPPCVNPKHLFVGTQKDNVKDMIRKGRENWATGDRNGARTHPEKVLRGEGVGTSKLNKEDVIKIQERYLTGESQRSIAKDFKVCHQHISVIVNKKQWVHV